MQAPKPLCSGIFVPLKSLWKRLCSKEIEVFNKALQPVVIQRILQNKLTSEKSEVSDGACQTSTNNSCSADSAGLD
jgi:hypothetical protein